VVADNEGDAAYDVAARTLASEARGAAGERTLTPHELEEKEAARLAALEKDRRVRCGGLRHMCVTSQQSCMIGEDIHCVCL
jgi:hypothetical protein